MKIKNTSILKKFFIFCCIVLISLYGIYLVIPYILTPIANKYIPTIEKTVKDTCGLDIKIENLGFTTSANFHVGIKAQKLSIAIPDDTKPFFNVQDFKGDIKLLPLINHQVEFGVIRAKNLEGSLTVKKDGTLLIQDFLLTNQKESSEPLTSLPFGLKLSNTLPNIHIGNYKFAFIDSTDNKSYYIQGDNFDITDFILDKKIKVTTKGKIIFDEQLISNFDIKIFNKIMPNVQLDDLLFPKDSIGETEPKAEEEIPTMTNPSQYTLIDIFKLAKKNNLRADIQANIKVSGTFKNPIQNGTFEVNNMSVAVNNKSLPTSYAKLIFKGDKTDIDSIFYTSEDKNEITKLTGVIQSGKKTLIDIALKSNAKFNNIIRLLDSLAQSFGINDLKTISAKGEMDANFNIHSDLKTINSNGYLKVKPSSLTYGLYNIKIDNINADVNLQNNNINIKEAGFSIMGHPLTLMGTIKPDATADLKINANKLSIKGLLAAAGQVGLLKDNDINSGTISLAAIIKGKLDAIKPDITLNVDNVNAYNKPMATRILLNKALVKLNIDKDKYSGDVDLNSISLKQEAASVSIPSAKVVMDTKDLTIKNSYVLLNNSRVDVTGDVKDYLTEKLNMNIKAVGNLSASDIMAFIPKELHSMFPYKGTMPITITATGNDKTQNVKFDLTATPDNYIQFADINLLKGKNTKIHADMKISNAETLKFQNSGIYANSTQIATFGGGVNNLSSNPKLNINVSVPQNVSFPIWGMGKSNITAYGNMTIGGTLDNLKFGGKFYLGDMSIKDMDFAMKNIIVNLNGTGIAGNATADSFKFGGITAKNLSSKFSLIDYDKFYLDNIVATSFDGKVTGKVSYNIATTAMGVDISGKGMNSTDAVYGAIGIPKALTGTLGFIAKFTAKGTTDIDIIRSMKGNISFDIQDGRFISIGKLENLVAAQNIASNSLLKSAISALSTANAVQQTDKFKSITGEMTLSDGTANISYIKIAGPMMSSYVNGKYYLVTNNANLNILGRIDSKVVSYLGPLGQLSAEKLLSYIPGLGASTAKFLDILTQDPKGEKTNLIPALTSGSDNYKDFKVIYNGSVEKASSVKVFKWLSKCDTTEMNIKKDIQDAKKAVQQNIENRVKEAQTTAENVQKNVENIITTKKQQVEDAKNAINQTKQDIQNAKNNIKNLWNSVKNPQTQTQEKTQQNMAVQEQPQTETTSKPASTTTESAKSTTTETSTPSGSSAETQNTEDNPASGE